jgi:hypothetical protein
MKVIRPQKEARHMARTRTTSRTPPQCCSSDNRQSPSITVAARCHGEASLPQKVRHPSDDMRYHPWLHINSSEDTIHENPALMLQKTANTLLSFSHRQPSDLLCSIWLVAQDGTPFSHARRCSYRVGKLLAADADEALTLPLRASAHPRACVCPGMCVPRAPPPASEFSLTCYV